MTTYYDAPEPDDLQRRCWITDDGQCRLYNGHEGGHDFGGEEATSRVLARLTTPRPVPHPETDSEWLDGEYPYAKPWTEDEMDSFWGFHAMDNPDCEICRWLATLVEYLPPATPDDRLRSDGPEPDRADPERRAEGLTWSGGFYCTTHERFCQRASGHRAALTPPPAGNELEEGK